MEHTYTTKEVAQIMGFSVHKITKDVRNKVLTPADLLEGRGRHPYRYVFNEEGIRKYGERIGVEPIFENSGRTYTASVVVEEEAKEEQPNSVDVISEYYMIRLGEYWLTDKMSLSKDMNNAKKIAVDAYGVACENRDAVGGKMIKIQTVLQEVV